MNNENRTEQPHDHRNWPRDFDFRTEKAEQQELIRNQRRAEARLRQLADQPVDSSAYDF